jgi:hypothetical protein
VLAGAKMTSVDRSETQVVVTLTDASGKQQQLAAERMLMGIGIMPNTKDLGLSLSRRRTGSARHHQGQRHDADQRGGGLRDWRLCGLSPLAGT